KGTEIRGLTVDDAILDIPCKSNHTHNHCHPERSAGEICLLPPSLARSRRIPKMRPLHTMPGSSHENAIAARCGRGVKKSHWNQLGRSYERLLAAEQRVRIRVITVDIRRISDGSDGYPTTAIHQPHKPGSCRARLNPGLHSSFSRA